MRQLWKAAIGVIAMTAIVVQTIPLAGAAKALQDELAISEERQGDYQTDLFDESIFEEAEEAQLLPYPIAEITEERDTYTKVFRMSDGSYTAAVYPQPVHFEQEGEMKEIDNTLELVTKDGRSWYKNQQSSVQFLLPIQMSAFAPIQVEAADGSEISFVMRTGQGKRAAVADKPDIDSQTAKLREFIEADTLSEEQFEAIYHKKNFSGRKSGKFNEGRGQSGASRIRATSGEEYCCSDLSGDDGRSRLTIQSSGNTA